VINIFRNQQNILFVCPTNNFGTRERMLLRDVQMLKEIGHNVFVYCLRDSYIDLSCKQIGVDSLYHEGKEHLTVLKWYKLRKLKHYIQKLDITIVHCYELNFLWPLAFFLRRKNLTPLFFTLNHDIKHFYAQFWYKTLISRLDLVFLPVREMIESIHGHLHLPLRKIYFSGMGLKKVEFQEVKKKLDESVWNIACWVNSHEIDKEELRNCLQAIWSLNMNSQNSKPTHLHLYGAKKWDENILYKSLLKMIEELNISDYVYFQDETDVLEINADIWLSYITKNPLEDYSIIAILKGIPTITPRNSTTQELHRIYGQACSTYMPGDSRELRMRLEDLMDDYSTAVQSCARAEQDLWAEHGEEGYKYNLFRIYEKHLNKRKRFYL
jgi:hypothetical protein